MKTDKDNKLYYTFEFNNGTKHHSNPHKLTIKEYEYIGPLDTFGGKSPLTPSDLKNKLF